MNFIQRCRSTAHLLNAALKPWLSASPKLMRLAQRDSHRCPLSVYRPQILVKVLPVHNHHYQYLLIDVGTHIAIAIDPLIPDHIIAAAKRERVELIAIFVTHHHHGKKASTLAKSNLPIYAGDRRTPCLTYHCCNEMEVKLGRLLITCVHAPSHTRDSYCFYVEGCYRKPCDRVLFTGDVLVQGGCGAFREGTARHLFEFAQLLRRLPHDTMIYGGKEATIANMQFAQQVEPKNELAARRLHWARLQQKVGMPSVPSTVREEMCWNPFLRSHFPAVKKFTGGRDDLEIISILREMRDHYRPPSLQPKPKKELKIVKQNAKAIQKEKTKDKKAAKKAEKQMKPELKKPEEKKAQKPCKMVQKPCKMVPMKTDVKKAENLMKPQPKKQEEKKGAKPCKTVPKKTDVKKAENLMKPQPKKQEEKKGAKPCKMVPKKEVKKAENVMKAQPKKQEEKKGAKPCKMVPKKTEVKKAENLMKPQPKKQEEKKAAKPCKTVPKKKEEKKTADKFMKPQAKKKEEQKIDKKKETKKKEEAKPANKNGKDPKKKK